MPSYVDGSSGIVTTGNVSATGNITGNYFVGNGSQLTGITAGNVDFGNVAGNIIPAANVTYSLGNSTNQWLDLWVSNNTIYLNSVPIALGANNDLLVNNVPVVLSSNTAPPQTANIATTAAVIAGNLVISNVTPGGAIVFPDGTTQNTAAGASSYGDSNVEALLSGGTITGNIETTGNIIGAYLYGDGSNITGLPASYGNSDVQTYLASNANVIVTTTGDITTTANISGAYILGNGSQLTGLPASYGNANVADYLPTYSGNIANLTVTGNLTATTQGNSDNSNLVATTSFVQNVVTAAGGYGNAEVEAYLPTSPTIMAINGNVANTNANVANTDANVANLSTATANNTSNIAQLNTAVNEGVVALANTNANVANTNSNVANLQSQVNAIPVINTIPAVYLSAVANGNGQVFSNVILGGYTSNASMTVFLNGALLENTFYTLSGDALTINTYLNTGDNIDVITTLAANVNNVSSGYGNSNVALFFNNYAGNIVPATDNAYNLGALGARWATVHTGTVTATGNVTSGGLYVNGAATITGNMQVQGNLTYNNITNLTTSNLVLGLGNTQTGANVTGGGIVVGNTNEAALLYNYSTQAWVSNIGITSNANITASYFVGDGSQLTNLPPGDYGNANVAAYLPTYSGDLAANNTTFSGTVTANGNTNGTAFAVVGNGAASNVALGFFPAGNTPAEMAIRDYSTVTSTMYFDNSIGGTANGSFQFRTSNAYTLLASVSNTGLTVNSTQTSNTTVNSTIYYNTSTSQYTAGPSMAAFGAIAAPFGGNITAPQMGHWIQAQNNIVLPNYTTVPAGTVFTITNSASGGTTSIKVSVFDQASDFLYYPPQYSTTNRFIELFFGQWIQVLNRGTGEWDVIASNINAPQKVWASVAQNVGLSMDSMNFRYTGTRFQFSPVSGSFTVFGQTLTQITGSGPRSDGFTSGTYSSGTWYDLTGVNITIAGSTAESFLTSLNGTWTRMYRATCMVDSTNLAYITVERLYNSTL